jgi:TonB family protein
MAMRRLFLAVPFLLTVPSSYASSNSRPVRLEWGNVDIVMMADSCRGTLIWGSSQGDRHGRIKQRDFVAYAEPARVYTWTQELREFLTLRLTSEDTGSFRASPALRGRNGDWIYLVRLKQNERWSDKRFIVMQGRSRSEQHQLLIEGNEQNAIEFLEELESVNLLALALPAAQSVDSIPILNPADTSAGPVVEKNPPRIRYPESARQDGKSGDVWLSYVVTAAGSVDSSSIEVIVSDGAEFASTVRTAVQRTRFTPAQVNEVPIPMRVYQKFAFRITGCSRPRPLSNAPFTDAELSTAISC